MRRFLTVTLTLVAGAVFARTLVVDPAGGEGSFTTIQAAADEAKSGDTVLVEPGVYREQINIWRGATGHIERVTFRSRVRDAAVIKGSEVWSKPWQIYKGNPDIWESEIDLAKIPTNKPNPYLTTLSIASSDKSYAARPVTNAAVTAEIFREHTLGQIFVDGAIQNEMHTERDLLYSPGSWMVSDDGRRILLHLAKRDAPIGDRMIEWSVRGRIFNPARRGLRRITIDGFTIEHCCNQGPFPQIGAISIRSGYNWIIEHNTVRFARGMGIDIGGETWDVKALTDLPEQDRRLMGPSATIVRWNTVNDNGVSGIGGWGASNARVYNNIVFHNGCRFSELKKKYWGESAGIKFHGFSGVIANNIVSHNGAGGVWLDTGFHRARITGNLICRNKSFGVMMESCFGRSMIDNNIVAETVSASDFNGGDGIYSHNGSMVTVAHNLLYRNAGAGVLFRTIWGTLQRGTNSVPYATSENRYVNNMFVANNGGDLVLDATNRFACLNESDHNLFYKRVKSGEDFFNFRAGQYRNENSPSNIFARAVSEKNPAPMTYGVWESLARPLDLNDWRRLQGMDAHSLVTNGFHLAFNEMSQIVTLKMPPFTTEMGCRKIAELDFDYSGFNYGANPHSTILPGPFQNVTISTNIISIGAMPFDRSEPPPFFDVEKYEDSLQGVPAMVGK